MKKLLSLIFVVSLVFSSFSIRVNATELDAQYKYKEKFDDWVQLEEYDPNAGDPMYQFAVYFDYGELYEHLDANGDVDWVLISAKDTLTSPWEVVDTVRFGNRIIKWWIPGGGFPYVIYDAKQDLFIDLTSFKKNVLKGYDVESFEGLSQIFDTLDIGGKIGDVDMDNTVTILDVTEIQLYLAGIKGYNSSVNAYEYIHALADMDEDSQMTVMDATAIQLELAKVDKNDLAQVNEIIWY